MTDQGDAPPEPPVTGQDPNPAHADWQAELVEQKRQGREQELWSIPAISIAAQAFLFTTGLAADTKPAARLVLGVIGLLTAVGTLLAVLRQAARVYIAEQWMEEVRGARSVWSLREQLLEVRRKRRRPETTSVLERLPQWILGPEGHRQISTGHIWTVLLVAFGVADVLVILSAISGIHLLNLGS
jgi:hypothetical protein